MHGEQGARTGKRELHSRAERDRQTRLAARTQPQAEVFAHAAAPDGEARSRFSGQSGPINPNIIGAAAPLPAPAEKPLPPDLQRLHERKIAVRDEPEPAPTPEPDRGVRGRRRGILRPVETCDGLEPHLVYKSLTDAIVALGPDATMSALNYAIASGKSYRGRRWRDARPQARVAS